jgi:hypothetical protein
MRKPIILKRAFDHGFSRIDTDFERFRENPIFPGR